MKLPQPRGPVSEWLIERLGGDPDGLEPSPPPVADDDPLTGDDLQLALYVAYELHYRSFDGVDERLEWEPSLLSVRRSRTERDAARLGSLKPGGGGAATALVRERPVEA